MLKFINNIKICVLLIVIVSGCKKHNDGLNITYKIKTVKIVYHNFLFGYSSIDSASYSYDLLSRPILNQQFDSAGILVNSTIYSYNGSIMFRSINNISSNSLTNDTFFLNQAGYIQGGSILSICNYDNNGYLQSLVTDSMVGAVHINCTYTNENITNTGVTQFSYSQKNLESRAYNIAVCKSIFFKDDYAMSSLFGISNRNLPVSEIDDDINGNNPSTILYTYTFDSKGRVTQELETLSGTDAYKISNYTYGN